MSSLGHNVIGIEFIQEAVENFFADNKLTYIQKKLDSDFTLFQVIFECLWKYNRLL